MCCSADAEVEEIVNMAAIAVVDAQETAAPERDKSDEPTKATTAEKHNAFRAIPSVN